MDQSIERRYAVYRPWRDAPGALVSCPADQVPVKSGSIVFTGTQRQCERYMRDVERCRMLTRQALGKE